MVKRLANCSSVVSIAPVNRLSGLDAVRGIAALVVAVHHLQRVFGIDDWPLSPAVSVYTFFILSGFVMARTYEPRFGQGLSTVRFLMLRYRRLFLPMAVGSTIGLLWIAMVYGLSGPIIASYLAILLFLPAPWLGQAFLLNGPAWSLFVEIFCNALHPVFIAPARQLAGAIALCFTIWALAAWHGLAQWQPGFAGIATLLPGSLGCYILGVYVYRRWGERPLGPAWLAFVTFLLAACAGWHFQWLEPAILLLAGPVILRCALSLPGSAWAFWIGAWSFPLYAVHQPVMRLARDLALGPVWAAFAVLIVSAAITAAVTASALPVLKQRQSAAR